MKDIAARSEARALTHTYAIQAREETTTPDVIAGTFYIFNVIVYVLIDPRSTHSYLCTALVVKKKLLFESTDYDIQVTNPLGQSVTREVISVESKNLKDIVRIISAFSAQRLMPKGNEAFLAYIIDTRGSKSKLDQLLVVSEFANVFLEELSSLPPEREVEFVIDVIPRITLISVTLYRMALAELKELKAQLQEVLD
ncbi:uncharacterized protein [Gossypium hirsutum]|uniref:Uncharacterized protein n=1 Tax=Gossypium hirsutum TaxID=3635 RepID=A0A1U8KIA1_GOSHI|nr:uncharacterized protein LOC107917329 [Gossypium hirsutum]